MLRRSGPRSPTRCSWPTNSVEDARSHPRGERLALGRWLEERLGPRAAGRDDVAVRQSRRDGSASLAS